LQFSDRQLQTSDGKKRRMFKISTLPLNSPKMGAFSPIFNSERKSCDTKKINLPTGENFGGGGAVALLAKYQIARIILNYGVTEHSVQCRE